MAAIIQDGTYEDIILKSGKKVTLIIENDEILSPIKIIHPDGKIEIIHHTYDRVPNSSIISRIKVGFAEIREITRDVTMLIQSMK